MGNTKAYQGRYIQAGLPRLVCLVVLVACCVGCCQYLHLPAQPAPQFRDSLVIHVKDSIAIKLITVKVPVPVEVMREIVPAEDYSHLETSVAESTAYIDSLGRLHHDLQNKAGTIEATVPVQEHYHSADTTHEHAQVEPQIVTVEKPLSKFESFKIRSFWRLCGALLLAIVWIARKPLLYLIKTLLKI